MSEQPAQATRPAALVRVQEQLKEEVAKKSYVFAGPGAERQYNLSRIRFNAVISWLSQEETYEIHYIEMGKPDDEDATVIVKILTRKNTPYQEVWQNRDKILKMWVDAQQLPRKK